MAKDYDTEDGSRIAPLGELDDYEVAEGYHDIRGWRVNAADGTEIGKVHELLVDLDTLQTRYLDVRLTADIAAAPEDRDVLVPIGAARVDDAATLVTVPLTTERIALLPPYLHDALTREQEYEVRRHFSFGKAAAGETEVRVPLQPDESAVLKRGEDGQDEIVIRRPRSDENRAP
jgi:photosynthetic reaction center H subunit